MYGLGKYPKSKEKMSTGSRKLTKLKEYARIRTDKSQHALLWYNGGREHLHVLCHEVPQESAGGVLKRSKVPWGPQFGRKGAWNSCKYFLPNSSGCRVPQSPPRVGKRKLQGQALELTHPTADLVNLLTEQSRVHLPGNYFHRRQRTLSHLHPAQTSPLVLLPQVKSMREKCTMSEIEWTSHVIQSSLIL